MLGFVAALSRGVRRAEACHVVQARCAHVDHFVLLAGMSVEHHPTPDTTSKSVSPSVVGLRTQRWTVSGETVVEDAKRAWCCGEDPLADLSERVAYPDGV